MKKISLRFLYIFTIFILLFVFNNKIQISIYKNNLYFLKHVFPSIFPVMIISLYLKYNVLNQTNNKYLKYLCLCLFFAPSNALFTDDENITLFTTNINPFFTFNIIYNLTRNTTTSLKIVLVNLVINYLFLFYNVIIKNKLTIKKTNKKKTFNDIIKETMICVINIFGITTLFTVLSTLLINIKIPSILIIFLDAINGFNIISILNYKKISIILLNSFCGLNIFTQIKSINNKIGYKFILKKFILASHHA